MQTIPDSCWIPVTERLPDSDRFVIIHFHDNYPDRSHKFGTTETRYMNNNWVVELLEFHIDRQFRRLVTHWMDWPESPKTEGVKK